MWEPVNPYCWMLRAQWFQKRGQKHAEEATLREMLRLFPRNVAAHVELARLLVRRGQSDWQEAEHYLQRAMAQDPSGGHAHVVMAHLQELRGRHGEAREILEGFLTDNPNNQEARDYLDRLQAGSATTMASRIDAPQAAPQGSGVDSAHAGALQEVLHRGRLSAEFSRARFAGNGAPQGNMIGQESRLGDSLAGFYSQWLKLDGTPECPPHAWAWDACLHWQKAAAPNAWRDLAKRFPEAAAETDFLRSLICPGPRDPERWRRRYGNEDGVRPRAVDILMHETVETWERLVANHDGMRHERDEIACTVMACAAADAPVFMASLD